MNFVDYLKLISKSILFYLLFLMVGFGITGKIQRSHRVIPQDTVLQVNGHALTSIQLAEKYQPKLLVSPTIDHGEPDNMFYEISEQVDELIIIYHVVWHNEDHPNLLVNAARKMHNLAYYGFNFKDIEFIQLNIDRRTGRIKKVMFPTFLSEKDDRGRLIATQLASGQFSITVMNKQKTVITEKQMPLHFEGTSLVLQVANWNHLMTFPQSERKGLAPVSFNLNFLENTTYKQEKIARHDHSDVYTGKSPANMPIIFFVSTIILAYFILIQRDYLIRNKQLKKQIANG